MSKQKKRELKEENERLRRELVELKQEIERKVTSLGQVKYRKVKHEMNDFVSYPDNWPPTYNACKEPCCFLQGPCVCGAWHKLTEWD